MVEVPLMLAPFAYRHCNTYGGVARGCPFFLRERLHPWMIGDSENERQRIFSRIQVLSF